MNSRAKRYTKMTDIYAKHQQELANIHHQQAIRRKTSRNSVGHVGMTGLPQRHFSQTQNELAQQQVNALFKTQIEQRKFVSPDALRQSQT